MASQGVNPYYYKIIAFSLVTIIENINCGIICSDLPWRQVTFISYKSKNPVHLMRGDRCGGIDGGGLIFIDRVHSRGITFIHC